MGDTPLVEDNYLIFAKDPLCLMQLPLSLPIIHIHREQDLGLPKIHFGLLPE
jgi:hypothetical protein